MRHRRLLLLSILLLAAVLFLGMRPFQFAAISVQTTSTPVLGAELCTDPGFDVTGTWTKETTWAVSGSSAGCVAATGYIYYNLTPTAGLTYRASTNCSTLSVGTFRITANGTDFQSNNATGIASSNFIGTAASNIFGLRASGLTGTFTDISLKTITLSSLLAPTRPWQSGATVTVTPTTTNCGTGQWLGGSDFVNDTRNPTQGVFWWIDRTTGNMRLKVLTAANTWSADLVNSAFTFTSGQIAKFEYNKTAKTGKIMYNNVQIGATQDLSAYSWIDQNRRHAIYSTTAVVPDSVVYTVTLLQ